MSTEDLFLSGAETHAVDEIERAFAGGLDPNREFRGRTPAQWLVEGMYLRSKRFIPSAGIARYLLLLSSVGLRPK